jgi:hypothetical protein
LLEAALAYAARGWYVLPCRVQQKARASGEIVKDVHLPRDWRNVSTVDVVQLAQWFGPGGEWSDGSVAIDTGRSRLVVVDLDCSGGKNGFEAWAMLGGTAAEYVVATPSGGAHLYYAADPERPVGIDSAGKLGVGIDVRGIGGLVIAPPSADWRGAYRETPAANWMALTRVPDIVAERVPLGGAARPSTAVPTPTQSPGVPSSAPALARFALPPGIPKYAVEEANRRILAALDTAARTPEGSGFNHALNEAAFELGHWVAGGHLSHADAEDLLSYVVTQQFPHGPNGDDLATIDSGLGAGAARPYAVFTPAAQAVLDSAERVRPGKGFARLPAGSITNRPAIDPPTVYDPGSGALFYPEGVHWLFGESGSGKTWVAMHAVATVLKNNGTVLYLDYEDNLTSALDRLAALGVDDQQISGFAYVDALGITTQELLENIAHGERFTLSVLDGVTSSLTEFGQASNSGDDVTKWANAIPRRMTGAVVAIDHVTKSADSRNGYAIGSQAKKAVVTGASYEVVGDPAAPLGRGRVGRVQVVLRKDKRGALHVGTGQVAARLEFSSSQDGSLMGVRIIDRRRAETPVGVVNPSVLLVARLLEEAAGRGDVNLADGMRKLGDWVRGHGHLTEGGSKRKPDIEEAIRYARGWSGMPGVADRYKIKPMSDLYPDARPQMIYRPQGVPKDFGDAPQDHGDAGDAKPENGL